MWAHRRRRKDSGIHTSWKPAGTVSPAGEPCNVTGFLPQALCQWRSSSSINTQSLLMSRFLAVFILLSVVSAAPYSYVKVNINT